MLRKFQRNSRNSFYPEYTRRHEKESEKTHQEAGCLGGAPSPQVVPPGRLGVGATSWLPPLTYIYLSSHNYPRLDPFLVTYLCSAAVMISISGGDRRTYFGTLPEEEDHPGGLYVSMTAFRMILSSSTLYHGSMAVASW